MMVHRIWSGGPMPEDYRRFGQRWADLNPGVTVHLFDETWLRARVWTNQKVVNDLWRRDAGRRSTELFAQLADVIGYELVYRFGGLYVNCDVEPVRPLGDLTDEAFVCWEDDRWLVNSAMYAPEPGHPFFGEVIAALPDSYARGGLMNRTTGPGLLTACWRKSKYAPRALDPVVFGPHHWRAIPRGGTAEGLDIPPETVAVHHWGHRRDGRTNRL